MRWFVGDLQGCARELELLLEQVRFDRARDELWAVGDLVNRGPESLETLRLWRDVAGRGVIGNHDVHALKAAGGSRSRKQDTLDDLLAAPDRDELLGDLRRLPLLVFLPAVGEGPDVWLVHAGIHPRWSDLQRVAARNEVPHDDAWLDSSDVCFATRVRCCTAEGELSRFSGAPRDCPSGFRPWDEFYRGSTLVVHGHWARRGYYRTQATLGLDSGCVYGGPLTAWCQDEDRIVQVPAQKRSK